ncbi:hypothetical protein DPMN_027141 [Dreissena polymorpha]|uniref:Uncharacterized protein n=1 Tax=Dreissena polymorpha TaxID=45954 RepID=A0A9D4LSB7_DREPO|nr:hypothetical protein DPMN_027141 [Dreissena polymorpha]
MLKQLELPPLQERRKINRLVMLYKVAKGLVPAIPATDYLKPARVKRQIKAKQYSDCVTSKIIDKQVINNDRGFVVKNSNSNQYKNSFFVKTIIELNHLDSRVVHAETVEGFKSALHFDQAHSPVYYAVTGPSPYQAEAETCLSADFPRIYL